MWEVKWTGAKLYHVLRYCGTWINCVDCMGHRQWCLTQGFERLYVAVTESTIWLTNFAIIHLQCLPCRVKWRPSGTSLGARHMENKSKLFRQYPAFTGSLCPVKYGRPFSSMVLSHDNWCSGWMALCPTSSAVLQQQSSCLPQDLPRSPSFMTQQCFIPLGCNIASLVFQALWPERRTAASSKHQWPRAKCLCEWVSMWFNRLWRYFRW